MHRSDACEFLYDRPERVDPPDHNAFVSKIQDRKRFTTVTADRGDVLLLHGLLPHTNSVNHLLVARIISSPHAILKGNLELDRADGQYVSRIEPRLYAEADEQSPIETAILRALDRPEGIPEYLPTRERLFYYPRTVAFKRAKVAEELERMLAAAKARGLGSESVTSVYLRGEEAMRNHERRNGYHLPVGPNGVNVVQQK